MIALTLLWCQAALVASFHAPRATRAGIWRSVASVAPSAAAPVATLESLLAALRPLGEGRFIAMRSDRSCILEATVQLPETSCSSKLMHGSRRLYSDVFCSHVF